MSKKRVLWVNEANFLATGFSTLSKSILDNLYKTNKFELAELGSYARSDDPRSFECPWKFYGAMPHPQDELGQRRYASSPFGQFGQSVFEQVCLDFHPDIIIDWRDAWMITWQLESPYRKNFKIAWNLTIDGEPQRLPWIEDYLKADLILTYSQYGKDTIERESGNKVKVFGITRPGVDPNVFKPLDKTELRKKYNIPNDAKIITTTMRNQRRKLYPDLIEMFAKYIRHCANNNNEDLAKNTYLHMGASIPDVGWDIPKYIMQSGVGHKILLTYICEACKGVFIDNFQSEMTICKSCGNLAAHTPNTQTGVTRGQLAEILNLADAYIQYSICEGLSLTIAEGKACGLPAFAIDYTAQSEQVNVDGCYPIRVQKFFTEPIIETEQKRALPDDNDCINKLYKFFCLSSTEQKRLGELARKDASENYSFDRASKIVEDALDSIEVVDQKETWFNPKGNFAPLNVNIPKFNNYGDLVNWVIDNILGKPELKNSIWSNDIIKGLNVGYMSNRFSPAQKEQYNPDKFIQDMINRGQEQNFWEQQRLNLLCPQTKEKSIKWEMI